MCVWGGVLRYSSTISLASALEGIGRLKVTHRLRYPRERVPVSILQEAKCYLKIIGNGERY